MIIVNNRIPDVIYLTSSLRSGDAFKKYMERFRQYECLSNPFNYQIKVVSSPSGLLTEMSSLIKDNDTYNRWIYVIFDYISFVKCNQDETDDESTEQYSSVVRALIVLYPEIQFFFDETATLKKYGECLYPYFLDIVELQNDDCIFQQDAHVFDASMCKETFSDIIGTDHLFDASNLRYLLKKKKCKDIHVRTRNYEKLQDSRAKNLAICVEEERSQNLFNSYSAYASGFRVASVMSASSLKKVNTHFTHKAEHKDIVLRDYDLQFADQPDTKNGDEDEIYQIRGWKVKDNPNEDKKEITSWEITCLMTPKNKYWGNFVNNSIDIYYITKGESFLDISLLEQPATIKDNKVHLPGINKPVSGLYYPLCEIPLVSEAYNNSRDTAPINRRRTEGGHGVPLDIYNWVKDMLTRAESYYDAHRYIHSAVLCQEAIEIMNGFHTALMIRAYSMKAIAENSIAAGILGGSEKDLCEDVKKRISYISLDVERLLGKDKEEFSKNVLNQIFSSCRNYCKEKELFAAEDLFIGAMSRLNEHYSTTEIKSDWRAIKELFKKSSSQRN